MLNYETLLGCVCFGWKWFQEIIFRKIGCLVGLENWIFRKSFSVDRKIVALTTEIHFRSYFHFKWFSELGTRKESLRKGRTRERERTRDRAVRSRTKHRSRRLRSTLCEIASSIAIWDHTVDREIAPCSSGFVRVFLGFVSSFFFSNFFSKRQKIFFEKYFEMQPNTWKHFPFHKITFMENEIFSGNAFTRTKHSLRLEFHVAKTCPC